MAGLQAAKRLSKFATPRVLRPSSSPLVPVEGCVDDSTVSRQAGGARARGAARDMGVAWQPRVGGA